jgi:hypothetical protein
MLGPATVGTNLKRGINNKLVFVYLTASQNATTGQKTVQGTLQSLNRRTRLGASFGCEGGKAGSSIYPLAAKNR